MSPKLFMVSLTEREPVPLQELVRELLLVRVQVLLRALWLVLWLARELVHVPGLSRGLVLERVRAHVLELWLEPLRRLSSVLSRTPTL